MSDQAAAPATAPVAAEGTPAEGQAKEQPKEVKSKPPQFRKYKVGNEEVNLSDEDIARDYGKWKGADAKFREAAQAKESVQSFMKALQEDPEAVLNDPRLPLDRKKLAEKWLRQQIEQELTPVDPRDAKLKALEEEVNGYKTKEQKAKEAEEAQERSVKVKASMDRIGSTLKKAGELSHLSAHPESEAALVREMALYMRAAREQDIDVTPEQVVEAIHNQRFQQYYTLANQFEGEELLEFLGEAIVTKMRKADLARLRSKREGGAQHKASGEATAPTQRKGLRMDPLTARALAKKLMG